jgi:hypothetical protein
MDTSPLDDTDRSGIFGTHANRAEVVQGTSRRCSGLGSLDPWRLLPVIVLLFIGHSVLKPSGVFALLTIELYREPLSNLRFPWS